MVARWSTGAALVAVALGLIGGVAAAAEITGTLAYRERMALGPGTIVEAELQDVTTAGTAMSVASVRFTTDRQVPIPFAIPYDETRIVADRRYAVRASLSDPDGRVLFTTPTPEPVLTQGAGASVDLLLRRAQAAASASTQGGESWGGGAWRLDLAADQVFALRQGTGDAAVDTIGRWSQDGATITLHDGREQRSVAVANDGTLRLENADAPPLQRLLDVPPLEPSLELRGTFVYFADSAHFRECVTERPFQVAMEGDYLALERAYTSAGLEPQAPLVVTLRGRLGEAPPMEGEGLRPTLFVERFIEAWPRESCGTPLATASFTETYWKLTRLGGKPVPAEDFQREPHLIFHAEDGRYSGSGGCNNLAGGWKDEDGRLSLGQGAMTMMACPTGMDTERQLVDAMSLVTGQRITGSHLELLDKDGAVVARFEAVALP